MNAPVTDTRTFRATIFAQDCGVIRERLDYTLTISGPSAAPTAVTLDGQPCTVQRALAITRMAQESGRFEKVAL